MLYRPPPVWVPCGWAGWVANWVSSGGGHAGVRSLGCLAVLRRRGVHPERGASDCEAGGPGGRAVYFAP